MTKEDDIAGEVERQLRERDIQDRIAKLEFHVKQLGDEVQSQKSKSSSFPKTIPEFAASIKENPVFYALLAFFASKQGPEVTSIITGVLK